MWTNRQFWLDSLWRSFRTVCQTLGALLAAQFSGVLAATGVTAADNGLPHTPWAGFLYASAIAGLISLLQSVDRERAVSWNVAQHLNKPVAQDYSDATYVDPAPTAPLPEPGTGAGHNVFGESLR